MLGKAMQKTFLGLLEAESLRRAPAPISKLTIALKCGGSDGFSGLSANPALGHLSDIVAALGGRTILAEFPGAVRRRAGVDRSFGAKGSRGSFHSTHARLCSARQGGRCEFRDESFPGQHRRWFDHRRDEIRGRRKERRHVAGQRRPRLSGIFQRAGLNLLCTPGGDIECVTGQVGAGANVVLFTTGLGTPTGNPIAPVVKISSNTPLANRMSDIIDFDAGPDHLRRKHDRTNRRGAARLHFESGERGSAYQRRSAWAGRFHSLEKRSFALTPRDSDSMRIDAHQHFWKFNPVRDAWITEEMGVLRRDFLPQDLVPELAANQMDASIAVQADQSEEETHFSSGASRTESADCRRCRLGEFHRAEYSRAASLFFAVPQAARIPAHRPG